MSRKKIINYYFKGIVKQKMGSIGYPDIDFQLLTFNFLLDKGVRLLTIC